MLILVITESPVAESTGHRSYIQNLTSKILSQKFDAKIILRNSMAKLFFKKFCVRFSWGKSRKNNANDDSRKQRRLRMRFFVAYYVSNIRRGTGVFAHDPSGHVFVEDSGWRPRIILASFPAAPRCKALPGQGLRRLKGLFIIQYPHFLQKRMFFKQTLVCELCTLLYEPSSFAGGPSSTIGPLAELILLDAARCSCHRMEASGFCRLSCKEASSC